MELSANISPTPFGGLDLPALDLPSDTSHQLIVLGNGFDLACGLHSRFSDFFEPRMDALDAVGQPGQYDANGWASALRERGLTAWDLILRARKAIADGGASINWCDVEAVISDVAGMRVDPDEDNWHGEADEGVPATERVTVGAIREYARFLEKHPGVVWPSLYARKREAELRKSYGDELAEAYLSEDLGMFLPNWPSQQVGALLAGACPGNSAFDDARIRDALFEELLELERRFERFLSEEVARSASYPGRSAALLESVVSIDYDELVDEGSEVTVLSFNYTSPGIPGRYGREIAEIANVHGLLGGEVIFGADGTGCMGNPAAARFSKTYRLMRREGACLQGEVAHPPSGAGFGRVDTVAVKFYGHSLSRADYSYFQSIFDIVDLYSGSTRLYFLYSNYAPTAREDLLQRVTRLLDAYGATMDNRDHGRNLIHKLLLEGRLLIREIEVPK